MSQTQRPSSSLGFNSPCGFHPRGSQPRLRSGTVGSSGVMLAAELYNTLVPLENLDDHGFSIPPPPYELVDTNKADRHDDNHHNNQLSLSTQSFTSNTIPLYQGAIPSGLGTHDHQRRAPRGPRPLLIARSQSEVTVSTGSHQRSGSRRNHAQTQPQTHQQPQRSPQKLTKCRPPPPNIVHQDKVNQVYQSPVYYPLPSPENLAKNRPPLTNTSRVNGLRVSGLHRSNHIKSGPTGSSAHLPRAATAVAPLSFPSPDPIKDAQAHPASLLARLEPPIKPTPTKPAARDGMAATLMGPSASHAHPRAGQTRITRLVCPECRYSFHSEHLMRLHHHLVHTPHNHLSKSCSPARPPHTQRPPPPLPNPGPAVVDHTLRRRSAHDMHRSTYFT